MLRHDEDETLGALPIDEEERAAVEDASALSPRMVFEAIRLEGEEELERPLRALWFSGVAAGLLISFSVLGEAWFRASLPDAPWRAIVENLGYAMGFLLVILGRMQLFTENTITTVVPVLARRTPLALAQMLRLWGVVLTANVVGAFLAGWFIADAGAFAPDVIAAITELSHHAVGFGFSEALVRGIPAGILIAALVWMAPGLEGGGKVFLIIIITWAIAFGDFTHVVAGSVEAAFLLIEGQVDWGPATFGFFVPVLLGNVIGGTLVFTMLAWGQIKADIER